VRRNRDAEKSIWFAAPDRFHRAMPPFAECCL
jgi:hypothetical protein